MALLPYILQHFYSLYPKALGLNFAYGTNNQAPVTIKRYTGNFFQEEATRPKQVVWKVYKDVRLPFFFEEDESQELISYTSEGSASVNYDIMASAFYLLSGWQEYYSHTRDRYGRFPYKASIQAELDFVTVPVINYYFEVLREALEQVYHVELQPDPWQNNSFATCLTTDVDRLQSAWKAAGSQRLKAGQFGTLAHLLLKKATGFDAWNNLKEVTATAALVNAPVSFFFLAAKSYRQQPKNADYVILKPVYQKSIAALHQAGHEIALHGSFGTATDRAQLQAEIQKLPVPIAGNRFHYLCHTPTQTTQVLQQSELAYDTTLGFAEHFGFRNSYCHPFYPFDFENQEAHTYLELPLLLMDTTLMGTNYMDLRPSQVLPQLQPMLQEVIKFRGLFTLLWHNENFSRFPEYPLAADEPGWQDVLLALLRQLQSEGATFMTCSEAVAKVTNG